MQNSEVVAITDHHIESTDMPWRLRTVDLSPPGDAAVVLVQARNGEFFVNVHQRESHGSGFTLVRRLRLDAHTNTIRTLPKVNVFSPCGRYVLVAFGYEPFRLAGLVVLDLYDSERDRHVGTERRTGVGFLECRSDLLPQEMHWNGNGLWLLKNNGALLLGL